MFKETHNFIVTQILCYGFEDQHDNFLILTSMDRAKRNPNITRGYGDPSSKNYYVLLYIDMKKDKVSAAALL